LLIMLSVQPDYKFSILTGTIHLSINVILINSKGHKECIWGNIYHYVIPQGSLQLSVQLSQASAKILTG
jgi:hypothetical protein